MGNTKSIETDNLVEGLSALKEDVIIDITAEVIRDMPRKISDGLKTITLPDEVKDDHMTTITTFVVFQRRVDNNGYWYGSRDWNRSEMENYDYWIKTYVKDNKIHIEMKRMAEGGGFNIEDVRLRLTAI